MSRKVNQESYSTEVKWKGKGADRDRKGRVRVVWSVVMDVRAVIYGKESELSRVLNGIVNGLKA